MRRWQRITCVLLPFAAGYFLACAFRTINSVISQPLGSELVLSATELGFLTSVFFLCLAVVQLPFGSCLDRFGPRRVQLVLLPVAATGALVVCLADKFCALLLGRVLIGIGASSALMAGLKAIALWFPRDRVALASGVLVTLGSLGAVATTLPAEALLPSLGWRGLFGGLGVATAAIGFLIYLAVPDIPPARGVPTTGLFSGVRLIWRHPYFWRLAPLSTACIGASWSLQGLWAAQWLSGVEGLEQTQIAQHLFIMAVTISAGALLLGILAYRMQGRVGPDVLLAVVAAVSIVAQISLIMDWPIPSYLIWAAIVAPGASTVLSFSALTQHFPREIAGQANAALSTLHVLGAFLLQFATGMIIQQRIEAGDRPLLAFQTAFAAGIAVQTVGIFWYVFRTRAAQRATLQPDSEANWHQLLAVVETTVKRWKMIALGATLCSAFLLSYLIAADPGVSGQDDRAVFQTVPASVADSLAEYVLTRFVQNIRSLSSDAVAVRSRWVEAYAFLTNKAARELTDEIRERKPFSAIGERAIVVDISDVKRLSENAFEIRWRETAHQRGEAVKVDWFVAKVWVVLGATPKNPFDLSIDAFHWCRERSQLNEGVKSQSFLMRRK